MLLSAYTSFEEGDESRQRAGSGSWPTSKATF